MPATVSPYGWQVPLLGEPADGPDGFLDLGSQIAATLTDGGVAAYTPTWTSDGALQPSNPSGRTGQYKLLLNGVCWFRAQIIFGGGTSGGNGPLRVGLPFPAKASIPSQACYTHIDVPNSGTWMGRGEIRASESTCLSLFPIAWSDSRSNYWQSANSGTADPSTGIPRTIDGSYTVQSGGRFTATGTYLVA